MSLPDQTTVLIVGAGPTGLATALSLRHRNFHDFVVVDSKHQGENLSRAMVVHSAALEALDTIGCGDDIASQGIKATILVSECRRSTKLSSLDIGSLKSHTRHPYALVISQNVTERALEKKLTSFGVPIYRPHKVVGLVRNAKNPQLTDVVFEDGRVIVAKYVIGADGVRSTVRTTAGIGFSDPTSVDGDNDNNMTRMVLADVTFSNISNDDITPRTTYAPDTFFFCFPMPSSFNECVTAGNQVPAVSERVYRIGGGVPLEEGEIPRSPSKEYIQAFVDRFGPHRLSSDPSVNPNPKTVQIKQVFWTSSFRTRSSIADTSFVRLGSEAEGDGGVVILVGDASHVHSPAGGQGMNLGIRDGIFLGEALVEHMRVFENKPLSDADVILHNFAETRHARALEVIKFTKLVVSLDGLKYRKRMFWWLPIDSETFRRWILWAMEYLPFAQRILAWEMSGLGRM